MRRILITLATISLAIAGCGAPVTGTVTAKKHEPGYAYTILMPCGGNRMCPYPQYVPDCYQLTVETPDDEERTMCVKKDTWDGINIGDKYTEEP